MIILNDSEKDAIQDALTKRDLLDVVAELGLGEIEMTTRYADIVDTVIKDLDTNGVPEWGDCSKLLRKFLMTANITDSAGELIEAESPTEEVAELSSEEIEYPDCYGFADELDPACNKCKVMKTCLEIHEQTKPPCYGKEYLNTATECAECLENVKCEELSK